MTELPEILNIPQKLLPLISKINDVRYFVLDGGRSSGKTQAIARLLLWLSEQKTIRIVCGREVQNSVEESVYTVFVDLIRIYNLYFDIFAAKIVHKGTGSTIHFRGFREQGAANIKGLEGVSILWVDEAQAISKQTLDVIIPTIRKENSKIIWSMNRHIENDPVFAFFATRTDCLHIHLDYRDNPFCPEAMKIEAESCLKRSPEDYEHIWLGAPMGKSDDFMFSLDMMRNALAVEMFPIGQRKRVMSVDVARFGGDEIVYCILESRGFTSWEQIYQECYKNKTLMETAGKIIDMVREFEIDRVVVDDTGMGGGVTDRLCEFRIDVVPFNGAEEPTRSFCVNKRADGYFKLQEWFEKKYIKPYNDPTLLDQLCSIQYRYKSDGKKLIMSKDDMRKAGLKSPDRADALMMAVYYCDAQFQKDFETEAGRLQQYAIH